MWPVAVPIQELPYEILVTGQVGWCFVSCFCVLIHSSTSQLYIRFQDSLVFSRSSFSFFCQKINHCLLPSFSLHLKSHSTVDESLIKDVIIGLIHTYYRVKKRYPFSLCLSLWAIFCNKTVSTWLIYLPYLMTLLLRYKLYVGMSFNRDLT